MRARSDAFVVSVRSSPSIAARCATRVSISLPEQGLAAREPDLLDPEADERAGDPLELLEGQELLPVHEPVVVAEDRLRHAVRAAEVAAVGDRDPQVAYGPTEGVERVHTQRVRNGHRAESRRACLLGKPAGTRPTCTTSSALRPGLQVDRVVRSLRATPADTAHVTAG